VVLEIASPETWSKDLTEKRDLYAQMGVQEYFVYDPNEPPCWQDKPRLRGWRLAPDTATPQESVPDEQGRLWSVHLDSWLVPDGQYLRLYDRYGNMRLTGEEAQARAKQAEARRADAEAKRADAEARRAAALAEKLRALGLNPDEVI
jgi:hypothetical protein